MKNKAIECKFCTSQIPKLPELLQQANTAPQPCLEDINLQVGWKESEEGGKMTIFHNKLKFKKKTESCSTIMVAQA